jgi:hypothetical protein
LHIFYRSPRQSPAGQVQKSVVEPKGAIVLILRPAASFSSNDMRDVRVRIADNGDMPGIGVLLNRSYPVLVAQDSGACPPFDDASEFNVHREHRPLATSVSKEVSR